MRASDVRIVRHALIRHAANPYDPSWESYYEGGVQAKLEATLLGRAALQELGARQGGRCAGCGGLFTGPEGGISIRGSGGCTAGATS
jgi:RNA-directed DNA polymerase